MIEPMLKITIACLESQRQSTIEQLQALGSVHVLPASQIPETRDLQVLQEAKDRLHRLMLPLLNEFSDGKTGGDSQPDSAEPPAGKELEAKIQEGLSHLEMLRQAKEASLPIRRAIDQLAPWGEFEPSRLEILKQHGIHTALCVASANAYQEGLWGETQQVLSRQGDQIYFIVLSRSPLDESKLPLAPLPDDLSLPRWQTRLAEWNAKADKAEEKLRDMSRNLLPALRAEEEQLTRKIEFATARDSMASAGILAFLTGYLPKKKLADLQAAATQNGWALRHEEIADEDEEAPTLLKLPRGFQMAKLVLDFVGILPGYHETDVSVCVMIFLALFCGMLVGDAAYGLLFTLVSLIGLLRSKSVQGRQGCRLLLFMSLCILLYGSLTGTWLGIDHELLPRWMRGLHWFTSREKGNSHIQLFCFFLGAIQMSLACAWRALLALKSIRRKDHPKAWFSKLRGAIGQIGWGIFLWGNFLLAKLLIIDSAGMENLTPACKGMLLGSAIIILICSINWLDMGDVIYAPFTFINCFVDILSYIRLFAVGLSSMYIAQCFNRMAMELWHIHPAVIPAAILVMGLGHLLNIALACMGVLVHGVRLNTLEFSGHMNISWTGKPYHPLK